MWRAQLVWCLMIGSKIVSSTLTTSTVPEHSKPYNFGYTVKNEGTGDFKTHHEVNDGKEVRGMYSLGEPNGDLRVVTYTADRANGFRATVKIHPGGSPVRPTDSRDLVTEQSSKQFDAIVQGKQSQEVHNYNKNMQVNLTPNPTVQEENHNNSQPESTQKINSGFEKSPNTTDNIVEKITDLPPLDKHLPEIKFIFEEGHEEKDDEPIHVKKTQGPKIIPVKIQEVPSDRNPELLKSETNIEMSTFAPIIYATEVYEYSTSLPDHDLSEEINSNHTQNKSYNEKNADIVTNVMDQNIALNTDKNNNTKTTTKLNSELLMIETPDTSKTTDRQASQHNLDKLETHQATNNKSEKSEEERDANDSRPTMKDSSSLKGTNDHVKVKTIDNRPNNKIMLAALMIPTTPVLKFKCVPDSSSTDSLAPTVPSNVVSNTPSQVISTQSTQEPVRMILTTGIPLYPFQLVNYVDYTSHTITNITPQNQISSFSLQPKVTAIPSLNYDGSRTMVQQQIAHAVPTAEGHLVTQKPPNGYTSLRNEETSAHKKTKITQSGHYFHHFLPPPWAPHPLRPHSSHYRHLPIFVLPMSHNFNFAPTFNPGMFDKPNH